MGFPCFRLKFSGGSEVGGAWEDRGAEIGWKPWARSARGSLERLGCSCRVPLLGFLVKLPACCRLLSVSYWPDQMHQRLQVIEGVAQSPFKRYVRCCVMWERFWKKGHKFCAKHPLPLSCLWTCVSFYFGILSYTPWRTHLSRICYHRSLFSTIIGFTPRDFTLFQGASVSLHLQNRARCWKIRQLREKVDIFLPRHVFSLLWEAFSKSSNQIV